VRALAVAVQNAGAAVADAGATLRPAGFNVMPVITGAGALAVSDSLSGTRQHRTAADTVTIDTGTAGTTLVLTAAELATQTIAEGLGVTISWFQGTAVATGPRVLSGGGVMTINYDTATDVHIWGSGIT
jgi:hypothetical protein